MMISLLGRIEEHIIHHNLLFWWDNPKVKNTADKLFVGTMWNLIPKPAEYLELIITGKRNIKKYIVS